MAMASTCATNFNWIRLFSFEVSKNRAIFFPNERTFDSLCTHKHEMELTTSVIEIQTYDIFHPFFNLQMKINNQQTFSSPSSSVFASSFSQPAQQHTSPGDR
jgi:hypothetical protein